MHVNRIYGGAVIGGGVAGAVSGFGFWFVPSIFWAFKMQDVGQLGIGVGIGLIAVVVGVFPGMAVGFGASAMGALAALVARLFGERVSTPMMIIAGAVGTMPVSIWLLNPFPADTLRSTTELPGPPDLAVDVGVTIVIAAIAAVSLNWLFSPRRRFGGLDLPDETMSADPVPTT